MKPLFTLGLALLTGIAAGQSFQCKNSPSHMKGVPGNAFYCTFTVTNTSADPIKVFVERYQKSIPPYWSSCFCYLNCEAPTTDTLPVYVAPFGTEVFSLFFKTDSVNPGLATTRLYMHQVGFEGNVLDFSLSADTRPDNVAATGDAAIGIMPAFENPAKGRMRLFSTEPVLEAGVFDIAGRFHRLRVSGMEADVSTLPPGIYILDIRTRSATVRGRLLVPE